MAVVFQDGVVAQSGEGDDRRGVLFGVRFCTMSSLFEFSFSLCLRDSAYMCKVQ